MSVITKRVLVALFLVGASSSLLWAQSPSVQVQTAPGGVTYLTDGNGMTLYYFTHDTNGQSACYGKCAEAWPIFYAPNITVPSSLQASDFGTVTRTDGTMQTTYKGWPLYYWFKDKKPGEMTGEGVGGVWYIVKVPFYSVMIGTNQKLGNYLVDSSGRTLYYFTKDSAGQSACTGECIQIWPAFNAGSIVVPSAVNPSDFGSITRPDGTVPTTFKGYPLYYFAKDSKPGDANGQGVRGIWFVVNPEKFNPGQ